PEDIWVKIISNLSLKDMIRGFGLTSKESLNLCFRREKWDFRPYKKKINGAILYTLARKWGKNIKEVNLKGCNVNRASIKFIISNCSQLRNLECDDEELSQEWEKKKNENQNL